MYCEIVEREKPQRFDWNETRDTVNNQTYVCMHVYLKLYVIQLFYVGEHEKRKFDCIRTSHYWILIVSSYSIFLDFYI